MKSAATSAASIKTSNIDPTCSNRWRAVGRVYQCTIRADRRKDGAGNRSRSMDRVDNLCISSSQEKVGVRRTLRRDGMAFEIPMPHHYVFGTRIAVYTYCSNMSEAAAPLQRCEEVEECFRSFYADYIRSSSMFAPR